MKTPEAIYRECAEYILQLHLKQCPNTGAIDALKTAYDEFTKKAQQALATDKRG